MALRGLIDRHYIKRPRLREVTTRILFGHSDCEIQIAGVRLTINRLRENGYLRAALKARNSSMLSHEIHVANVLSMLAWRTDTFVDAGANVGFFSCLMARYKKISPDYKILAFEPHPDTYRRLRQNGARYEIETFNFALSDVNAQKTFIDGAVSHVFTAADHANAYNIGSRRFNVECRRLDDFVPLKGSYFIKIDTEGQELEVLAGAEGLFNAGSVAAVYIDGHDRSTVPNFLRRYDLQLLDIETLEPTDGSAYGLLALGDGRGLGRNVSAQASVDTE